MSATVMESKQFIAREFGVNWADYDMTCVSESQIVFERELANGDLDSYTFASDGNVFHAVITLENRCVTLPAGVFEEFPAGAKVCLDDYVYAALPQVVDKVDEIANNPMMFVALELFFGDLPATCGM